MNVRVSSGPLVQNREKNDLTSLAYRVEAYDRVVRDRVLRATLRPKPGYLPERLYQYLVKKLLVISAEDKV